jgi:benzoylformate decarboxylase
MTRRARDVLLDILRDEGVTHVFGNPGSTEMPLMDALVDAPGIQYVLGLQEATAVGMADGWALASGRAGFVNLHAMGGLGNAMGVLVASKASETPLVVTAGQQDTRHLMTEPWLSGDLVALAAPVTKWAKEVRRGEDVGQALRRAFAVARTPPGGPVFLSLPMDVLDQEVSGATPPASSAPRLGASPDAARLAERLAALDPDRVVVLLGDDLPAAASPGLIALAEAGGFPVWGTQLTSRVAFPSAHPSWAGVMKPDFAVMREHLESAQAIVLVGGRAFVAYPYRDAEPVPLGVAVMHVADNPEAFGREHAADMALVGDIGLTLEVAAKRLGELVDRREVEARLAARAARQRAAMEALRAEILAEIGAPLSADAAVLAALDALPKDALIANDSAATFGRVQELLTTQPGRYFFARGGVLGCNMPAAVGASLAGVGLVSSATAGRCIRRRRCGAPRITARA